MEVLDCGFSATLISVNTVLRLLGGGTLRQDANLQNYGARLAEYRVTSRSPLTGKMLKGCTLPTGTVLALLFRGDEVLTPTGSTQLQKGDVIVTIVTRDTSKKLSKLFPDEMDGQ